MPDTPLKGEALLREMERKSNDECMIYNVLPDDFVVNWDGRTFVVPGNDNDKGYGKGTLIVPRYIALHYLKHMTDNMINRDWEARVKKDKAEYEKKGEWFGQKELQIAPRTNNQELREKYMKMLWGGVVREFGKDEVPSQSTPMRASDSRTVTERLLDSVEASEEYKKRTSNFLTKVAEGEANVETPR